MGSEVPHENLNVPAMEAVPLGAGSRGDPKVLPACGQPHSFQGDSGLEVKLLDMALESADLVLPSVVLTEILSDPGLKFGFAELIRGIPVLEIHVGFWERAAAAGVQILSGS